MKSFPDKETRKKCWAAKDEYWKCLDKSESSEQGANLCKKFRELYEKTCPKTWVQHFDRKYEFEQLKTRMLEEGYDPVNDPKYAL